MNETFKVTNLSKFSKKLAKTVAKDSGFTLDDLKKYINVKNVNGIVMQHAVIDDSGNILVNEDIVNTICADIFDWMIGVELAQMAAQGLIECCWSDEDNCMVFWTKKGEDNNG